MAFYIKELWRNTDKKMSEVPYKLVNDGLGICNTGYGFEHKIKGLICALGGIGCNVDHHMVLSMNIWEKLNAK